MRTELLSLSRDMADTVARHLVAAGQIIDEDAELALQHAIAARRIASRIAVVREAVGLAAYAAGDWATAIAELRTYHRMSGSRPTSPRSPTVSGPSGARNGRSISSVAPTSSRWTSRARSSC